MIVVGWDGADGGEDALELGRLLGSALGLGLVEVSVLITGASPHAREQLERGGRRVVVAPSVARGLSDVASEEDAAVVVVGSSRRGPAGRALLGTDAEHLARLAPCPVAVAPRGYARRYAVRLQRIETDFDGSPESLRALELANEIVERRGGSVRVRAPRRLRAEVERRLAAMPSGVVYEHYEDTDGAAAAAAEDRSADLRILGRAHARVRHAHVGALLMI